jgi:hypothetical protein
VTRTVRTLAVALIVGALTVLLVACGGGGSTVVVTETVDSTASTPTETAPITTAPTETAPTTAPTTTAPTTSAPSTSALESRLPSQTAIPEVGTGSVRSLPTAAALVDALYQEGDPSKSDAEARFRSAGYQGGVLRDQIGTDPQHGIALFRAYVVKLGSPAAATAEVGRSVEEVRASSTASTSDLAVPGIPGARGIDVRAQQAGRSARVIFVTFSTGPYLYGYQAIAISGNDLPQDAVLQTARDTYQQFKSTP